MEQWTEEYYNLMFMNDRSIDSYTQAATIKFQHIPEYLYKYRTFCEGHLSALQKGVLFFTAAGRLNDVKEANIVISKEAEAALFQKIYDDLRENYGLPKATVTSQSELMNVVNSFFRERAKANRNKDFILTQEYKYLEMVCNDSYKTLLNNVLSDCRSMYSICSFSAANDVNQMWAHYADAHQGFCIEYDFKSLGEDDLLTSLLFPVIYVKDNRLFINNIDLMDGNVGLLAVTLKDQSEWGYEQEWRLVHEGKEDGTPQAMPKPTGIYLGERVSTKNKEYMRSYCLDNDIPLYYMKYNQKTNHFDSIRGLMIPGRETRFL